ncbi:hypothetical protein LKO27_00935 [Tessaracoccus sp. OS52]|uniref:hypothetical protein n=1 Tax=Tessaracoccus sp. OS52 TaxID=2886691 RepID=UPI001D102790|nr:hypothetical protein [Tessaracoccus sp. OS52]MCC2591995.1 hypothetical protein [Tessaracoccus sp. OS52]
MEPEELLADLDKELRSVLGALQNLTPVTEDVTVSDASGAVRVTVRPDSSLAGVSVVPAWQEKVEPAALADVISDVLGRAQAKAMGFDIDALEEAQADEVDEAQVEAARGRLLKDAEQTLRRPSTEEELQRRMDELPGIVDDAMARLDRELVKLQTAGDGALPQDPAEFTPGADYGDLVESDNRMVAVRVVAGLVAEVRIKESWLEVRSGIAITECFNQIIERLPGVVAAQRGEDQ